MLRYKNGRQNNQDYLISLLEDMCNKLANASDVI